MACGCGRGSWQSNGLVPATSIQNPSYFWNGHREQTPEEAAAIAAAWPRRVPAWSPQTNQTEA